MSYEDIDESIANCTELEQIIGDLINELSQTPQEKRKKLSLEIDQKIKALKQDLDFMDCEINEMEEGQIQDEYQEKYRFHKETVEKFESKLAMLSKPKDEGNQNVTAKDLMGKATNLQNQQKSSLDRSLEMANAAQETGNATLEEIKRQEEVMSKAADELDNMDGELDRAKKVMHGMLTRAAGDNCVRILVIIVVLCIIGVIVAECVAPGSIKNQVEKGFTTEGGGDNNTEII